MCAKDAWRLRQVAEIGKDVDTRVQPKPILARSCRNETRFRECSSVPEADVRLESVTKRFGDFVAVDDMSLEIPPGEFFSLLGPSGCGKTTTLRMIGGFEEVTEGKIFLGDTEVTDLPPFKRATNTVFQSYALFPHLSVFENIAFGLRRREHAHERDSPPGGVHAQARRAARIRGAPPLAAVRRPAAARRAGSGPRQQPAGPAARRAARRPRPQAAQADADRAEAHPERDRHHLHLRHPRPGRGDDDVRSHRRHAAGPDRAARGAGGAVRAPRDRVRRGLPRRQQPARRRGRQPRRSLSPTCAWRTGRCCAHRPRR